MSFITSGKNAGQYVALLAAATITAATGGGTDSGFVDVRGFYGEANARDVSFLFRSDLPFPAGTTVTVQLEQALDGSGTGAKNLNDAVTYVVGGEVGLSPEVEGILQASAGAALADLDHDNGFYFVRANLIGSVAVAGQLAVLGSNLRYRP